MPSLLEELHAEKAIVAANIAAAAARDTVTDAEIEQRTEILATRQGNLLELRNKLGRVLGGQATQTEVVLEREEDGTHYLAIPKFHPRYEEIIESFHVEVALPGEPDRISLRPRLIMLSGLGSSRYPVELCIDNGEAHWEPREGVDEAPTVQRDIEVVESVEGLFDDAEKTLTGVWRAVHNAVLNPELAARATALAQA